MSGVLVSRRLATAIIAAWLLLLVVWVVPFELYGLPAARIRAIVLGEPFFQAVYAALVASTAACMTQRLVRAAKVATRVPGASEARPGGVPAGMPVPLERAERYSRVLRTRGFRRQAVGDAFVWGVRNRFSPVLTAVWHLAFALLIVLASAFITAGEPSLVKLALTEGETFLGEEQQFADGVSAERYAALGDSAPRGFTIRRIDADFYRDLLLFTRLEATLVEDAEEIAVAVGRPWTVDWRTWLAIEDFGYSADVRFEEGDGGEPVDLVYRTQTFPAGVADSFDSPALGGGTAKRTYRVNLRVYGDYVERDGAPSTRSFNRTDPRLLISVSRVLPNGALQPVLGERTARVGERLDLGEDDLTVRALPYYGVFRMTRSVWALPLLACFFFLAAAASARLLMPRVEVVITEDEAGRPVVSARSDLSGRHRRAAAQIEADLERP